MDRFRKRKRLFNSWRLGLFYNDSGKVIEEREFLKDGIIISQRQFIYDSEGQTFEWRFFDLNTSTGKLELQGR